MKVAHKVAAVSSSVLIIAITILSLFQYFSIKNSLLTQAESSISESSNVLSNQISNWLNGKLELINYIAESIDADFNAESTSDEVISGVSLAGKVAVVTGASSGIGQGCAVALADAGAHVVHSR